MNLFECTHDEIRARAPKVVESQIPQVMQAMLDKPISLPL